MTNLLARVRSPRRPRAAPAAIFAIMALALALRLYGLNWDDGYPWTPHPDERAILGYAAQIAPPPLSELGSLLDADESPWNPRWFPYGSFPLYLLRAVHAAADLAAADGIGDTRIIARAISALADVGAVGVVYLLARALWTRRAALIAALIAALAVTHIQLSHFFAVDTLLALFCVATVLFLIRAARRGRATDSALAGLFLALALATKISAAPMLAAYFAAHLIYALGLAPADPTFRRPPIFDAVLIAITNAAIGGLVALAAFFIFQPYAILDFARFFGDVSEQSEMARRILDYPYTRQYIDTAPYLYHIRQLAVWGFGLPLGALVWASLAWATVRGLPPRAAAAYAAFGLALPAAIMLFSTASIAVIAAAGIAVIALIATLPARKPDARLDVILLAWVVPYFIVMGALDVKFMRYMLPVAPFLALFAAKAAVDIWTALARLRPPFAAAARIAALAGGIAVLIAAALYAIAYVRIYAEPHPAVRAAEWVKDNLPERSLILKEHWEESLPALYEYETRELPMYDPDSRRKTDALARDLADADALAMYSNRLYGTIARLPERYPLSRAYYEALFARRLGYEPAARFASYPNLGALSFADDAFARPDLPKPQFPYSDAPGGGFAIPLGYADESFTVYDHPQAMIFTNVSRLSAEEISERIIAAAGGEAAVERALSARDAARQAAAAQSQPAADERGLMMDDRRAAAQRAGGTWSDIFDADGLPSRLPVLAWLLALQAAALIAFPLAFAAFAPLSDRGWLLAKALGPLLIALVAWLLASLEIMPFGRPSIGIAAVAIAVPSLAAAALCRARIARFFRERWKTLALAEMVFLAAFAAFILIRMANPDLWHPWRGGEKPMDMAYLIAVAKSSYMPPYDPWFGGGYLNYYYWGQFITAALMRATGAAPEIAVNIAVPAYYAMTAAIAYSIGHSLAAAVSAKRAGRAESDNFRLPPPPVAGVLSAAFVAVLGNFDGAIQAGRGIWDAAVRGLPAPPFDFWRASRMMPPDPPGFEITEFPFFTFLFADPHAHLFALPFTLLAIGCAAAFVLDDSPRRPLWTPARLLRLAALGLAVGALRAINTWDYPTYLALACAAIFAREWFAHGGLALAVALRAAAQSAAVFAIGFVAFLPYHQSYETFFLGVQATTNTTTLSQFLAIAGLFVFAAACLCLWELRRPLNRAASEASRLFADLRATLAEEGAAAPAPAVRAAAAPPAGRSTLRSLEAPLATTLIALVILLTGFALTAVVSGWEWATVAVCGAMVCLSLAVAVRALTRPSRPAARPLAFAALMSAAAFSLAVGLDIIRVEGDIDRMNSVFKFYLQIWVLLALASAFAVWRLAGALGFGIAIGAGARPHLIRTAWTTALTALILAAAVYPVLGTRDRLSNRFYDNPTPLTLDGLAYAQDAVYRDPKGDVNLSQDVAAIRWMRQNIAGSPVVLEANTPTYQWGGRISIHTGLPSVVGWEWHQQQQRWGYRAEVTARIRDVERIYSTEDPDAAAELIARYGVSYIYVGELERLYYPADGIAKFADGRMSDRLRPVYNQNGATIYRVINEAEN